jgi:hypothetical protein
VNSAVQPLTAPENKTMLNSASKSSSVAGARYAGETKQRPAARQIADTVAVSQQ